MATNYKKAWVLCLTGATNAAARAKQGLEDKQPDAAIIQSLVEALWWVTAGDETLGAEYGSEWKVQLRPNLKCFKTIVGLRWARNRITHQICHWEMAKAPFNWESANTLAPPGSVLPHHDHGRAEYQSELEGKPALDAFSAVIDEITAAASALDPAKS